MTCRSAGALPAWHQRSALQGASMKYWTRGSLWRGKDTYSCLDQTGRITVLLALATLFSWLGEAIHNAVELPGLTILSLETSIPGIVAALFFGAYLFSPFTRLSLGLLLGWGLLNLVGGGIISVLPLNFLPFAPPQTVTHYLTHMFYSAAEIPLILITVRLLRQSTSSSD